MLSRNFSPYNIRFLSGGVFGMRIDPIGPICNAIAFGSKTSIPQGYNDATRALVPPLQTGGNIAARVAGEGFVVADIGAFGQMGGTFAGDSDFIADGNVYANGYGTFAGEADFIAAMSGVGNMEADFDILARPSAFDIAQEIWNAPTSGYTGAGTMGKELQDAKKAAKLAAALSA